MMRTLEHERKLEIVSGERLTAGLGRPITFRAGAKTNRLRMEFSPQQSGNGNLTLQMKPAIGAATGSSIQVPGNGSFLLENRSNGPDSDLASQLFPNREWEHRHLVILVSTHAIAQASTVAVAGGDRKR